MKSLEISQTSSRRNHQLSFLSLAALVEDERIWRKKGKDAHILISTQEAFQLSSALKFSPNFILERYSFISFFYCSKSKLQKLAIKKEVNWAHSISKRRILRRLNCGKLPSSMKKPLVALFIWEKKKVYQFSKSRVIFSTFLSQFDYFSRRKKNQSIQHWTEFDTSLPFVWAPLLDRLRGAFLGTAGRHLPVSASSRSRTCGRHGRSHKILHLWSLEVWDSLFRLVCL